jgi:hypothetical protein
VPNLKVNGLVEFCRQLTQGRGTNGIKKIDYEFRKVSCPSGAFVTNVGHEDRKRQTVLYPLRENPLPFQDDWVRTGPAAN